MPKLLTHNSLKLVYIATIQTVPTSRLAKRILPGHANPQPSFTKFGIWQEIALGSIGMPSNVT